MAKHRTPETWAEIRAYVQSGEDAAAVARRFGVGVSTIRDRKAKEGWRDRDRPDPRPAPPLHELDDDRPSRPPEVIVAEALARADRAFGRGDLVDAGRYLTIARQFRRFTNDQVTAARAAAADRRRDSDRRLAAIRDIGKALELNAGQSAQTGQSVVPPEVIEQLHAALSAFAPWMAEPLRELESGQAPPCSSNPPEPPRPPRPLPMAESSVPPLPIEPPDVPEAEPALEPADPVGSDWQPPAPSTSGSDVDPVVPQPPARPAWEPPIEQQLEMLRGRISRRLALGFAYDDVLQQIADLRARAAGPPEIKSVRPPPSWPVATLARGTTSTSAHALHAAALSPPQLRCKV